jgi:hypothetical protein
MKLIYATLLALAAGCSSTPTRHVSSSQWKNKLNCDDGLRVDADAYDNYQLVLFGDAAKHFADAGAFSREDFNPEGEYVRRMQPNRDVFLSTLQDGQLVMPTDLHHDGSSYLVRWLPYANGGKHGAEFWFKNCR